MIVIGNRYEIDTILGRGGMGTVYRATDALTGRTVAVKQLRREVAQRRPDMVERFTREAETLRQLDHPNMVKALDTLEHADERYIVMEYVAGQTLHAVLQEKGALPVQQVAQISIELADALTRAHYLEIIHRDLKPANVMIEPDGTTRLTDFGVAYLQGRERVTVGRLQVGTPDYMAPEALDGKPIDARADIWSLGIMMWEMLAGQHPWQANVLPAMIANIFTKPLPDLEQIRPDAPVALIDLIYRMLEKDPNARIPSVRLVGAELEMVLLGLKNGTPAETPITAQAHVREIASTRFDTPAPAIETIRNNLGAQTTAFVGREAELGELYRHLQDPATRLITLLGPGGMGKTRLALELAETVVEGRVPGTQSRRRDPAFTDGVFLVTLQPLSNPAAIPNALAEAIGFQFYPGLPPRTQLLDYFRDKSMLLIADNCEHLTEGLALLTDILHAAPGIKIIATSRAKLSLQGETLFTIDGMDYPDDGHLDDAMRYGGMRLFVQSARRVQPRFEMRQEYVAPVARICALVRGMPLGIELAAGWAEMLTPQEIADEVARCIDFLESGSSNIPTRQRSVRAVFDSSWRLLNDDEQRAFIRMAVFRGSFTRAGAQAVTGAGLRPLMGLVNKSFLQRDPDTGRYVAHELMRQFAEEMLEDSGEADAIMRAHCEFFLHETIELLPAIESPRQPEAFATIDYAFENVRAAFNYAVRNCLFDLIIDAAHPLGIYFDLRALYTEGLAFFTAAADILRGYPSAPSRDNALAAACYWAAFYASYFRQNEIAGPLITEAAAVIRPDAPVQIWAQLHMASGYYHLLLGDPLMARAELETATALFHDCGRPWDAAHAQMNGGTAYWYRNTAEMTDFEMARHLCVEALKVSQSLNEGHLAAYCYLSLGRVDGLQHAYETAAENLGKALRLFREARNVFAVGMCLMQLSVNNVIRGRIDDARPLILEDLAIQRQRGIQFGVAQALLVVARLELWAGNWEESRSAAAEALLIAEETGNLEFAHAARVAIARVDIVALEYDDARQMLEHAFSIAQQHDRRAEMCGALHELSLAYFCLDRFEDAHRAAQDMLQLAESISSHSHVAVAHFSIGRMSFFTKDLVTARAHFDAALAFLRDDTAQQSVNGWDDGYRYQTLYSVLADAAELELEEGNPDAARALLRDAINTAFKWNNVPGLFDGLTFGFQLLAAIGELEAAAEIAVFVREQPRAYAYTRSLASGFLRRLHQEGTLPNFHAIVNRPSALQLEAVVRLLLSRL